MAQLWGGRFTKETDKLVYHFNASISFDQRFFGQDIEGSIAHVVMLAKQGILTKDEKDIMKPWVFTSSDGRFEMTMTPEFDNFTSTRVLGVIGNRCHQVFGKWNGYVILDDGKRLEIKDMIAFCEHSYNRW